MFSSRAGFLHGCLRSKEEQEPRLIFGGRQGFVAGVPEWYLASTVGNDDEGYFNYLKDAFLLFKIKAIDPSQDVALENV